MREVQCDFRSGWSGDIGPSGRARRVLPTGKVEEEDPAGEEGDMTCTTIMSWSSILDRYQTAAQPELDQIESRQTNGASASSPSHPILSVTTPRLPHPYKLSSKTEDHIAWR